MCLALLLPLTYSLSAEHAVILLIGAMGSVAFSGSISAILINAPGTGQSAATCFDGYPLARQGRAGYALGAAGTSSALGAIFGTIVLVLVLPVGRYLVLAFSFPEYFMMAMAGLSVIIIVSQQAILKGFTAGILGLVFSSVGSDPITGAVRFTFGVDYLWDGINTIAALIGLFALAELVDLFVRKEAITRREMFEGRLTDVFAGVKAVFKHFGVFLQASIIGTVIGLIPGVGGSVANFIAYIAARQTSKESHKFGQGDIRGVIAPEAANDAKDGGALIPTLIFGIPGSVMMVIVLASLILHGITPGPRLMLDHPSLIVVLIYTLVLSNILCSSIGLLAARYLSRVTILSPGVLVPAVLTIAVIGIYAMRGIHGDIITALGFAALGYVMKRLDYPRIPLIIALMLGGLAQKTFHQTMILWGIKGFFLRPISLGMFVFIVLLVTISLIKGQKAGDAA
jgi:TctA family transporter